MNFVKEGVSNIIFLIREGNKIKFTHIIVYYMRTQHAVNFLEISCYYYIIGQRI